MGEKVLKLFRLHCHPCSVYLIPIDTIPTRSSSTIVALQVEMVSSRVVRQVELDTLDKPYRPYASLDFFLLG
jgi:hypothetical protein